jgi:hypothetical protein
MTDTARLRELLAKATPGPWEALPWEQGAGGTDWCLWGPKPPSYTVEHDFRGDFGNGADAALIAEAITALPGLLDEVDRLRTELFKASNRIELAAGLIHNDTGRDKAYAMAEETRAALQSSEDKP